MASLRSWDIRHRTQRDRDCRVDAEKIGIYSPERSIADAFRLRSGVGYELARDALREWLRRGGKPAQLIEMASRLPRAKSPVLQALQMLT